MIKIESNIEETRVSFYDERIWMTNENFDRLKNNLYLEYSLKQNGPRQREQIQFEDLNYQQFNCLVYKHQANLIDHTSKILDVRSIFEKGIKYFSKVDKKK